MTGKLGFSSWFVHGSSVLLHMETDSGLHPAVVSSVMKQLGPDTRHFSVYCKQLKLFIVHTKRCMVIVEV